jgi:hypothetical protein
MHYFLRIIQQQPIAHVAVRTDTELVEFRAFPSNQIKQLKVRFASLRFVIRNLKNEFSRRFLGFIATARCSNSKGLFPRFNLGIEQDCTAMETN